MEQGRDEELVLLYRGVVRVPCTFCDEGTGTTGEQYVNRNNKYGRYVAFYLQEKAEREYSSGNRPRYTRPDY
jgi:hypothetical protein